MTPRIAAIFGAEPTAIVDVPIAPAVPDHADDHPVVMLVDPPDHRPVAPRSPFPWPIVEGAEHFSIWQHEDDPWDEFVPGFHYDFRQSSRLQPLLFKRKDEAR